MEGSPRRRRPDWVRLSEDRDALRLYELEIALTHTSWDEAAAARARRRPGRCELGDADGACAVPGQGKIVFSCSGCPQQRSGPSLYVVNADGTGFRRILTPRLAPYGPRWSPNGRRISLSSRLSDIWTIDPAGRSARRLTHACTECDYPPAAWSPDGRRLAFARKGALFTMRSDGARQRRLFGRWRRSFGAPDWSPDGKKIVFDESGSRLHLIRADGKAPRELRGFAAATRGGRRAGNGLRSSR